MYELDKFKSRLMVKDALNQSGVGVSRPIDALADRWIHRLGLGARWRREKRELAAKLVEQRKAREAEERRILREVEGGSTSYAVVQKIEPGTKIVGPTGASCTLGQIAAFNRAMVAPAPKTHFADQLQGPPREPAAPKLNRAARRALQHAGQSPKQP